MKMKLACMVFILCAIPLSSSFLFRTKQRVIVRGRLLCGHTPASHISVKLVDKDVGPDDEMSHGRTDKDGYFELDGVEYEMTNVDPWLMVYHDCNNGRPSQRKSKWKIPKKYINHGGGRSRVMDFGEWNLEMIPGKEERD